MFCFLDASRVCFSACPPWFDICTRQCVDRPWYAQPKWKKMIEEDPEFAAKAKMYIPQPRTNSGRQCFSSSAPWELKQKRDCQPVPWYQQEEWIERMNANQTLREFAFKYIPSAGHHARSRRSPQRQCFSSSAPWETKQKRDCRPVPWYQQEEWIERMNANQTLREFAFKYIPSAGHHARQNSQRQCFSSSAPWELKQKRDCQPVPWYQQEEWIEKFKTDSDLYEKAKAYIPMPLEQAEEEEEEQNHCFPMCPPWFDSCVFGCAQKPWYLQEQWIAMMKEDPEFAAKAKKYIPTPK